MIGEDTPLTLTREYDQSMATVRVPFSFDFRWTSSDVGNGVLGRAACATYEGDVTEDFLHLPGHPTALFGASRDLKIPVSSIENVTTGGVGHTAMELTCRDPDTLEDTLFSITVEQTMGRPLQMALCNLIAARKLKAHTTALESSAAAGEAPEPETIACPHCKSEFGVTGLGDSPQWWCPLCGIVFANENVASGSVFPGSRSGEAQVQQCDECSMCGPVEGYTVVYVYFLIIIYALCWGVSIRCPGCFLRKAWAMLAINIPFVVGVPNAVIQLARVRRDLEPRSIPLAQPAKGPARPGPGASPASRAATRDPPAQATPPAPAAAPPRRVASEAGPRVGVDADLIHELGRVNHLAVSSGEYGDALGLYRIIRERHEHCATVKYNVGVVYARMGDLPGATQWFREALLDCANHGPSLEMLEECHRCLGEETYLHELRDRYSLYMQDSRFSEARIAGQDGDTSLLV